MSVRILIGDARERLRELPDESVHMCCTSPPYWGLRDYGVPGQLGLEATPEEHVRVLVEVFREVRRVMRRDATLWCNYGDAYWSPAAKEERKAEEASEAVRGRDGNFQRKLARNTGIAHKRESCGLKPKDLVGMPWRLAFALQADGWYLRSDIIWAKPNPMPESVTDRPTKSHEHLFLLAKAERYYYDADAVREPQETASRSVFYTEETKGHIPTWGIDGSQSLRGKRPARLLNPAGRNLRDVWTIPTEPFSGVSAYGSYRIGSPDCRVHGCRAYLSRALECGGLRVSSDAPRSLGIRGRHEQGQEGVAYAILEDQCEFLSDASSAIAHSNEIRRMAAVSVRDGSSADRSVDRSGCMEPALRSSATSAHTRASRTSVDASSDVPWTGPSERTASRILGIATFCDPPSGCSCQYAGKVEKRQDHFAAFPQALVVPCIKAGTSERGCCGKCGAPWERQVEQLTGVTSLGRKALARVEQGLSSGTSTLSSGNPGRRVAVGWSPGCDCAAAVVPCTVLDPFAGACTTLLVADKLGRNGIGIELNPDYARIGERRIRDDCPLFAEVEVC